MTTAVRFVRCSGLFSHEKDITILKTEQKAHDFRLRRRPAKLARLRRFKFFQPRHEAGPASLTLANASSRAIPIHASWCERSERGEAASGYARRHEKNITILKTEQKAHAKDITILKRATYRSAGILETRGIHYNRKFSEQLQEFKTTLDEKLLPINKKIDDLNEKNVKKIDELNAQNVRILAVAGTSMSMLTLWLAGSAVESKFLQLPPGFLPVLCALACICYIINFGMDIWDSLKRVGGDKK